MYCYGHFLLQVYMDLNQFVLDLVDVFEAIHIQEEIVSTSD